MSIECDSCILTRNESKLRERRIFRRLKNNFSLQFVLTTQCGRIIIIDN